MGRETESLQPQDLVRYVPRHVISRIARGQSAVAFGERMPAAALFADISGFTALSERLAARGGDGVEELTRILNTYFGRLISAVTTHGGDVVKFAGDALLAFWPVGNDEAALGDAARAAARCALAIQEAVTRFDAPAGERLSLRVGVGAGKAVAASLGGIYGRYEFVLSGPAVLEATQAAAHAEPGTSVAGPEIWNRISGHAEGTSAADGAMRLVRVRDIEIDPLPPAPQLDASAVPALLAYIPASIHRRLAARQSGWLAELRSVTALFVKLPGLGYGTPLETALEVMQGTQTELYRHEGSVNKLSVDEKGVTMLAALGLPPLAHEDDARRGTLAAMDIKARLDELGQKTSVGVNSGNVFCGTIGDETRCEYTLIGDVVNVSARLMQAADGRVLCGETTRKMAGDRIKWQVLEPIAVKGKTQPLHVFRPIRAASTQIIRFTQVTGRAAERAQIEKRLDALHSGRGGALLIEGEAGMGKSTLVDWMKSVASDHAIVVLAGTGEPAQASTPYFAWRPVFRRLFNLDDGNTNLIEQLDEASRPLAPLLEPVLALGLEDNETTAPMFGALRSDNTIALMVRLLRERAESKPHVIVIEDAHWLDSASWTLAGRVAEKIPSALLVVTARSLADPVPRAWNQLQVSAGSESLILGPMNPEDSLELVRRRLGVAALPDAVANLLRERAQGNPFFVQELATALVESGRIVVKDGRCEIAPGTVLTALKFPDTVQGVVTSRIDRLPAPEQLTLKVASVVGRTFTTSVLEHVYPIEEERAAQSRHLETLTTNRLVEHEDVSYAFSHAITQDVAYQLMAPTQRRELHGQVARWYETQFASELAGYYPLLAKHWTAAEQPVHAIDYLEKSGEAALRDHANEEALQFFEGALAMASADDDRRGSWLRQCAEAHYNLAQPGRAREVFRDALALLGAPLPATKAGLILGTLKEVCIQILHRYMPQRFTGRASRENALEAARAYERLAEVYYLNNEKLETIHAGFKALNLAETAGPSPELARTYANMTAITGLVTMHGTARAHAKRALSMATAINHPQTTAYVRFIRGLYFMTVAAWDEAESDLRASVEIAERSGERRRFYESTAVLSDVLSRRGKVAEAQKLMRDLFEVSTRRAIPQVQVWSAGWSLWYDHLLDENTVRPEKEGTLAAICLDTTSDLGMGDRIFGASMLALARFRRGDRASALEAADVAENTISKTDQVAHYLLEAYAALAHIYDSLWTESPAEIRRRMIRIAKHSRRLALMYPIGKPAALLIRGVIAARDGDAEGAAKLFRRSAEAAKRLGMPTFEAAATSRLA